MSWIHVLMVLILKFLFPLLFFVNLFLVFIYSSCCVFVFSISFLVIVWSSSPVPDHLLPLPPVCHWLTLCSSVSEFSQSLSVRCVLFSFVVFSFACIDLLFLFCFLPWGCSFGFLNAVFFSSIKPVFGWALSLSTHLTVSENCHLSWHKDLYLQ